ncbi:MAG TPA: dTMP kinase [Nocardioidaceae bacterium]|nr:dTMP kinase [Nocardioidaceae bacterium]
MGDSQRTSAPAHSLGAVLSIRAFRRLWIGLGLSSLGDWLGLLALTAYAATAVDGGYAAENFAIAGVLLLRVLPAVVIGPIGGYLADHLDRRWNLVVGDVLRFGLFASIPFVDTLWWVFVVTVLVEAVSLVWLPAKDATVPNLVPRARLEAANQLSIATTYGSALPAAALFTALTLWTQQIDEIFAGLAVSSVDVALSVNALTYLISGVVIVTLHEIPKGSAISAEHRVSIWRTIVEGWAFVSGTPLVRGLVVGIVGAFGAAGVVIGLARVHVTDLGGGDPAYGAMFGSVFLGLALGMWLGPRLLSGFSRRRLFGLSLTMSGLWLVPVALVPNLTLIAIAVVLLGFCGGVAWITGYTLLGLEVEDSLRGRTFAFVQSMIRLVLALVLAAAPALSGLIGTHHFELGDYSVHYHGAAITFLVAAVVAAVVGVSSYRQMDDRPGVPLWRDLKSAVGGPRGDYATTGVFVALEGGEGAGKSTQSGLLESWLRDLGYEVIRTHEPGDTPVGAKLRQIVLDPATGALSHRTEALLYAADKAEHVDTLIKPALGRGAVVVTDRYVDSTLAYQGAGRDLRPDEIENLARWSTADLRPHLTVLLDVAPGVGLTRFDGRDRLEAEPTEFHERVRAGFLELAERQPDRYLILDAARPVDDIAAEIRARVEPFLSAARLHRGSHVPATARATEQTTGQTTGPTTGQTTGQTTGPTTGDAHE